LIVLLRQNKSILSQASSIKLTGAPKNILTQFFNPMTDPENKKEKEVYGVISDQFKVD
jgi:hypothetical protein